MALAQWLAESGWAEYFLDISLSRGIAPGERWRWRSHPLNRSLTCNRLDSLPEIVSVAAIKIWRGISES